MSPYFERAFARTLGLEGRYSDHPADRGGPTMFGITEMVARANGYYGAMSELPLEAAQRIAKTQYWDPLRLDDVADLSPHVAEELFDTGYNGGITTAGRIFQRWLSALNRGGTDYPDLVIDGFVGPITVARFRSYMGRRGREGAEVLVKAMNASQGTRYLEIAEMNPSQEAFLYGWVRTRL